MAGPPTTRFTGAPVSSDERQRPRSPRPRQRRRRRPATPRRSAASANEPSSHEAVARPDAQGARGAVDVDDVAATAHPSRAGPASSPANGPSLRGTSTRTPCSSSGPTTSRSTMAASYVSGRQERRACTCTLGSGDGTTPSALERAPREDGERASRCRARAAAAREPPASTGHVDALRGVGDRDHRAARASGPQRARSRRATTRAHSGGAGSGAALLERPRGGLRVPPRGRWRCRWPRRWRARRLSSLHVSVVAALDARRCWRDPREAHGASCPAFGVDP